MSKPSQVSPIRLGSSSTGSRRKAPGLNSAWLERGTSARAALPRGNRCSTVESEIAAAEQEIAELETELSNYRSADETIRITTRVAAM